MSNLLSNEAYKEWLIVLKENVKKSQIKASISENKELIILYFYLGIQIIEKQKTSKWGSKFLSQLSEDLKAAFPQMKGFSKRNLKLMRQWVTFYQQNPIAKQVVSQIQNDKIERTAVANCDHKMEKWFAFSKMDKKSVAAIMNYKKPVNERAQSQ